MVSICVVTNHKESVSVYGLIKQSYKKITLLYFCCETDRAHRESRCNVDCSPPGKGKLSLLGKPAARPKNKGNSLSVPLLILDLLGDSTISQL